MIWDFIIMLIPPGRTLLPSQRRLRWADRDLRTKDSGETGRDLGRGKE
jgi:hypothetical protein